MTATSSVFAAIGNRAGALLLDFTLLAFLASWVSGRTGLLGPAVLLALAFVYVAAMPLSPLQGTLGKWVCRIKITSRLGQRLSWRASVLRAGAMLCWWGVPVLLESKMIIGNDVFAAFWVLFLLPWAPAGFLPRRESLFDLLAGSLVVRHNAEPQAIAEVQPAGKVGILNFTGAVVPCLLAGAVLSISIGANRDMNRRVRVMYAIGQTQPLREKIEEFHSREQRWPTPAALGVAEWTPYRDGGGYRLNPDGSILISFSVLRGLKGHSLVQRPVASADGKKITWQCSADAEFARGFLPAGCR